MRIKNKFQLKQKEKNVVLANKSIRIPNNSKRNGQHWRRNWMDGINKFRMPTRKCKIWTGQWPKHFWLLAKLRKNYIHWSQWRIYCSRNWRCANIFYDLYIKIPRFQNIIINIFIFFLAWQSLLFGFLELKIIKKDDFISFNVG